jgi:hypothetical protein
MRAATTSRRPRTRLRAPKPATGAWRARPAVFLTGALLAGIAGFGSGAPAAQAAAPVGQGFTVTPADLAYILKQIKIAEYHVAHTTSETGPCGALVGDGPNQMPSPLVSMGLRTVDGSCNNLVQGQEYFGASHQKFPRLTTSVFSDAEPSPAAFGPPHPTSYKQTKGLVFDSEPRVVSNLIVDQTATNPAAIAAAGFPVRTQGNEGVFPCTDETVDPPLPAGCVPSGQTLFIPNVTTDVGLSPPFNGLFTIFGQFFDHGVDKRKDNPASGTVFVPLHDDDPLVAGPDHIFGNADDLDPNLRFMVLTRSENEPGPDGVVGDNPATPQDESADDVHDAANIDTPFVDQSQTYTSDPSHQVFLREYTMNPQGRPVSTGKMISSADGGQANWAQVKAQAADLLGLRLSDRDVLNIPMLAVDPYGKFIPGPAHGLPQYVTSSGLVEGDLANPVAPPSDVLRIGIAFLDDIAHSAVPDKWDDDHNPATPPVNKVPDADDVAGESLDPVAAGEYDNELLDEHYMAGDGRVNENIALTAVHQIFHSEHDRLVEDIKHTLLNDTSAKGVAALAEWWLADGADGWNGERLFQAARFVTEMEYQHLVFEEFARKVQPAINPFQPFAFTQTDINPAVKAEFAHAVYRFGHSMLTEDIARTNADGSTNDIPLLDGFLNPAEYHDGGPAGQLTSEQAAGAILMGMSDQTGSEIDEFVTDTLRNNLLGLPLDLPAINMARARAEGIPPLNEVRRQIYAATNDSQLAPYTSWTDFGQNIKHPESLINFVAAYGEHPSITAESTIAGKREAARIIVDPQSTDTPPADAAEFMDGAGGWADRETGLNHIDLWVGGLAERTNLFGGLLGSTFNYVFESQLTDLQNSDRLYYLARTPGMNLRQQLEGNSFAELVMRNTNAHSLKADAFATADCKFELNHLNGTAAGYLANGNIIADDPATECNERQLLLRKPDGTIQYRTVNSVDPPGINGQSVYNGTAGPDRVTGGVDNDTFLGNEGADVIEGNDGADVALGGEGNDRITDSAGDDVLKGGPGNDAIESGPGLDIIISGSGSDFTNGGANANETFAGEGDDFVILGQGEDAAFGDSGDDWEEGGDQPDLLQGDSGGLFFTDPNTPGNDVLIGQAGDDDYDGEGGDDLFVTGPGIEKNAGAAGYDFSTGFMDPQPQVADLKIPILPADILAVDVRDRFNEVEALSGGRFDDQLHGDDVIPSQVGGAGFIGCDALDQAGLERIAGLDELVPTLATPTDTVLATTATMDCPLSGPFVWGEGNILVGGAGSDLIEGRGADDIIDGDAYLSVRLSVRTDPADPATEIGSTDLMEHTFQPGNPKTLQQAVFAGDVDPGDIVVVREILSNPAAADVDTALFSDVRANYTVTAVSTNPLVVRVAHVGGTAADGTDIVRNVERLAFADRTVDIAGIGTNEPPVGTVALSSTSPVEGQALTATQAFDDGDGIDAGTIAFAWQAETAPDVWTEVAAGATFTPTQAHVGARVRAVATYVDGEGRPETVISDATAAVANVNDTPTGAPIVSNLAPRQGQPLIAGTAGIADADGLAGATFAFQWQSRLGAGPFEDIAGATGQAFTPTGAQVGRTLRVVVSFTDDQGAHEQVPSAETGVVIGLPGAPTIGLASAGNASATVRWTAPADTGGTPITGYDVRVLNEAGAQVGALRPAGAGATSLVVIGLTNGATYRFEVTAQSVVGSGLASAQSNAVTPSAIAGATVPGAPGIGTAQRGGGGGGITAIARWSAPANNGGRPITGYRVTALRMSSGAAGATVLGTTTSPILPAVARQREMTLAPGTYRFTVVAINAVGASAPSARSNAAVPR